MRTTPRLAQDKKERRMDNWGHEQQETMQQGDEMERWRDLVKRDSEEMVSESHCSHMKQSIHWTCWVVVWHKPALEDDRDELDDFQIPKRLKIVPVKMYVQFLKSAASSGNRGMQTQLEQNSLTLEQKLNQENEKLMHPVMKDQP